MPQFIDTLTAKLYALVRRCVLSALPVIACASPVLAEDVPILTYHAFPPLVTERGRGLSYALAEYLTRKAKDRYTFDVQVLPRRRIDEALARGAVAIVPWVSPEFFEDAKRPEFSWTPALFQDSNVVVSRKADPIGDARRDSLAGIVFGGIAGHRYRGIDDLVAGGLVKRDDANAEVTNLWKLAQKRIDVTVMPKSAARYLIAQQNLSDRLVIADRPQESFARQLMVAGGDHDLARFVDETVKAMNTDAEWAAIRATHGIDGGMQVWSDTAAFP